MDFALVLRQMLVRRDTPVPASPDKAAPNKEKAVNERTPQC